MDRHHLMVSFNSIPGGVCLVFIRECKCPSIDVRVDSKYAFLYRVCSTSEYPIVMFFQNIPGHRCKECVRRCSSVSRSIAMFPYAKHIGIVVVGGGGGGGGKG